MAKLEFVILQHLEGKKRIVLQRDENQLLERLLRRTEEILGKDDTRNQAIAKAFHDLIKEFKDETIRIV